MASLIREGKPGQKWGFLDRFPIKDRTKPELDPLLVRTRIVCTPWFGIMLHVHHREDADRDMHDHPWPFASIVLRGGYVEEWGDSRLDNSWLRLRWVHAWTRGRWYRKMPLTERHSITWVEPGTITLIIRGRKKPDGAWGFYTDKGYVPHQNYKRCNPDGEYVR